MGKRADACSCCAYRGVCVAPCSSGRQHQPGRFRMELRPVFWAAPLKLGQGGEPEADDDTHSPAGDIGLGLAFHRRPLPVPLFPSLARDAVAQNQESCQLFQGCGRNRIDDRDTVLLVPVVRVRFGVSLLWSTHWHLRARVPPGGIGPCKARRRVLATVRGRSCCCRHPVQPGLSSRPRVDRILCTLPHGGSTSPASFRRLFEYQPVNCILLHPSQETRIRRLVPTTRCCRPRSLAHNLAIPPANITHPDDPLMFLGMILYSEQTGRSLMRLSVANKPLTTKLPNAYSLSLPHTSLRAVLLTKTARRHPAIVLALS